MVGVRTLSNTESIAERVISLGDGLASIPEALLLAHAQGKVLFIVGAGASMPANLPSFKGLVILVYAKVDASVHAVISESDQEKANAAYSRLGDMQKAEVERFQREEFDVVLGMLERRMDVRGFGTSRVRAAVAAELRKEDIKPAEIHKLLMRLADRGEALAIITTNFDTLLQGATSYARPVQSYALGGIPRPSRGGDFAGVMHIHGAIDRNPERTSDLILTDQDFGEFYLRRRTVPDFIYDAARLYHLVLVGYRANDPPMRYLLNAVAADGFRFEDLKTRYVFVAGLDATPVALEDWKARGMTPIPYNDANSHAALRDSLRRWADLSAINGDQATVNREVRRIVGRPVEQVDEKDRDLFEHLVRRGNADEKARIAALITRYKAHIGWLGVMMRAVETTGKER